MNGVVNQYLAVLVIYSVSSIYLNLHVAKQIW